MREKTIFRLLIKCVSILGLFGLFTWTGCSNGKHEMSNKVILVFQPGKETVYLGQNLRITIKYVDDHLIPREFRPGQFGQNKYVISTSREHIDLVCYYKTATAKHFFFRNGDSVRIRLEKKWPIAEILNRKVNRYESNFEKNKQQDLYQDKSSALEDYYYYWNRTNNPISPVSGSIISEELCYLKEKALSELDQESIYIDSLFRFEVIGHEVAEFFLQINEYEEHKLNLYESDKIDFSKTEIIEAIISNINSTDSVQYSRLKSFNYEFTEMYYIHNLLPEIKGKNNLDSIIRLDDYSTLFGKSLLYMHINQLLNSTSVKQGQKLIESFDGDSLLENWSDYFKSKYNLDQNFSTDWSISDNRKNTFKFNKVLQERQGEVLYIDFWASWCLSSIKEMPHLERLYYDYQDRPFEIIHISVDIDPEKWEWAEKEHLGFNKYNSFILNSLDLSTVQEEFEMDSIPRYLLFDKSGNLIHGNAPKPSDERLIRLLDQHLVE